MSSRIGEETICVEGLSSVGSQRNRATQPHVVESHASVTRQARLSAMVNYMPTEQHSPHVGLSPMRLCSSAKPGSSAWLITCRRMLMRSAKDRPQDSARHLKGFSRVCTRSCRLSVDFSAKRFSHPPKGQAKGRCPVCFFMCRLSEKRVLNPSRQPGNKHTCFAKPGREMDRGRPVRGTRMGAGQGGTAS